MHRRRKPNLELRLPGDEGIDTSKRFIEVGEHHEGSRQLYMSHKIFKLEKQFDQNRTEGRNSDGSLLKQIFDEVVIYVNGFTDPSIDEIVRLVGSRGGRVELYYISKVTHIICDVLPETKLSKYRQSKKPPIIVTAKWVADSVAHNSLLPIHSYILSGLRPENCTLNTYLPSKLAIDSVCPTDIAVTEQYRNKDKANVVNNRYNSDEDFLFSTTSDDNSNLVKGGIKKSIYISEKSFSNEFHMQNQSDPTLLLLAANEESIFDRTYISKSSSKILSTENSKFVAHFFKKSRLHHIGQFTSHLRKSINTYVSERNENGGKAKYSGDFGVGSSRVILHVDMDCFFVSVMIRTRPDLALLPVAIAHSTSCENRDSSSEISSCSYLAREKGVKAGMMLGKAKRLCPDLIVLPYNFKAFAEVSDTIYKVFYKFSPLVQAVSCDEAYLEFPFDSNPINIATEIREEIFRMTGCSCSVGSGSSMLLARLGTKKAKPNGQCHLSDNDAELVFADMSVKELPGVGFITSNKLKEKGIVSCRDVCNTSKDYLQQICGQKIGISIWDYSHGVDNRVLSPYKVRKSLGAEVNWGIRFHEQREVDQFLTELSAEVSSRLKEEGCKGQTVSITLKRRAKGAPEPQKFLGHGLCKDFTKTLTFSVANDSANDIYRAARNMLLSIACPPDEIRGLGIHMSKLHDAESGLPLILSNKREPEQQKIGLISTWMKKAPGGATSAAAMSNANIKQSKLCHFQKNADVYIQNNSTNENGNVGAESTNEFNERKCISGFDPSADKSFQLQRQLHEKNTGSRIRQTGNAIIFDATHLQACSTARPIHKSSAVPEKSKNRQVYKKTYLKKKNKREKWQPLISDIFKSRNKSKNDSVSASHKVSSAQKFQTLFKDTYFHDQASKIIDYLQVPAFESITEVRLSLKSWLHTFPKEKMFLVGNIQKISDFFLTLISESRFEEASACLKFLKYTMHQHDEATKHQYYLLENMVLEASKEGLGCSSFR